MTANFKITNYSFYFIVAVVCFFVIGYTPHNVFGFDVFGYYMYLPLQFKYHDITIQNYETISHIFETYHPSESFYQAIQWNTTRNWVMRYPIGLSVVYTPYYFIGDLIAPFTNYPADGFSKPYQLSVLYGCLFYSLLGLYFLKKILTSFFRDKIAAITLIAITLGTNYFFHAFFHAQGAMSHTILFTLYVLVLYFTIKWHQNFKVKYIIALGLCCGIAAICRPTELICIIIPFFYKVTNWASFKEKIHLLKKHLKHILVFSLIIISIAFIQFGYWKYVSGKFIINPYGASNAGEGLELLHPHLLEVLVSFRKGWLVYTPLMFFTLFGFRHLYKNNKTLFTPIFIYFTINFYIVASWSCWWYGACFGVRSLIPSYAVLSIPLAFCIQAVFQSKLKSIYLSLIILCISLNLFQSWQMNQGILDTTDMSRSFYLSTFLQTTTPTNEQRKLLLQGKFENGIELFTEEDAKTHTLQFAAFNTFENFSNVRKKNHLIDSIRHSGKYCLITNQQNPVSDSIEVMYKDISKKPYTWIKASVWLYSQQHSEKFNADFIVEMTHKGYIFKQKKLAITEANFKPNCWNKIETYYLVPDDLRSKRDKVRIRFHNKSKYTIYVDDLLLESYEPIYDKSVF
ncbi:MAG: hypothetical protein SFY56_04930 [Bacteroidota bacterium]|nr:hypothetical protein [Bacteroidota bacterium]